MSITLAWAIQLAELAFLWPAIWSQQEESLPQPHEDSPVSHPRCSAYESHLQRRNERRSTARIALWAKISNLEEQSSLSHHALEISIRQRKDF